MISEEEGKRGKEGKEGEEKSQNPKHGTPPLQLEALDTEGWARGSTWLSPQHYCHFVPSTFLRGVNLAGGV